MYSDDHKSLVLMIFNQLTSYVEDVLKSYILNEIFLVVISILESSLVRIRLERQNIILIFTVGPAKNMSRYLDMKIYIEDVRTPWLRPLVAREACRAAWGDTLARPRESLRILSRSFYFIDLYLRLHFSNSNFRMTLKIFFWRCPKKGYANPPPPSAVAI